MADGYWNRQQASLLPSGSMVKRPRSDYDIPSGIPSHHEMHNYLSRDNDRSEPRSVKDTRTIGSAYDRYLQSAQYPYSPSGEASMLAGVRMRRAVDGGVASLPLASSGVRGRPGAIGRDLVPNGRSGDIGDQLPADAMARAGRETLPLPSDASNTLYVEGLPPDTTRREVAHIFRPFVGYKEVRLVSKENKLRGGDPLILCFVDFANPACAATAMSALQDYKMDEDESDFRYLRLQFSRRPGPRSSHGTRDRR